MATFRAACWTLMGCGYIVDLAVRHHLAASLHEVFAVLERHQPPVHDASVGGVQGHDSLQGRDALGPCSHRCLRPPPRSLTLQYGSRSRISLASMMLRSRTLFFMPRSYRAFSLGTSSCSTATMSCRCGDTGIREGKARITGFGGRWESDLSASLVREPLLVTVLVG